MPAARPLVLLAALCAPAASQTVAPPVDPALRARFGFLGPEIHKLGDGINLLAVADLDGDARAEVIVNHGARGRLEILSVTEQGIEARSEGTSGEMHGLAVADLDGDGVADFLLLSARGRLVPRLRGQGAATLPEIEVGTALIQGGLRTADLDGDGKADAVVLTRDGLRTVTKIATEARVSPPDPVREPRIRSFDVFDVDGDGRSDVVIATSADRMALRIKLGDGGGGFGPWISTEIPQIHAAFAGTEATLATIQGAHRRVVEYRLRQAPAAVRPSVLLTTLPERIRKGAVPFVHADVDGDGDLDLVIADPEGARLTFLIEQDGGFTVQTVPTLAGVGSLAMGDLDGDGKADLVLTSFEEEALAWKSGALPLEQFPERLPVSDKPVVAAVHAGAILVVSRTDRRDAQLCRVARGASGDFELEQLLPLGRLSADPVRMIAAELDDSPGPELAFVVPGEGLRVVFSKEGGGFREAATKAGTGFTKSIEDGALSLATIEGKPALIVVRDRFARAIRFAADGQPETLRQDNGPEGIGSMSLNLTQEDGARVFLDRKAGKVYRIAEGAAPTSVDVPEMGANHLLAHHGSVLILGDHGVARVPFAGSALEAQEVRAHEPPVEKTRYYRGMAADLDGDGKKDLALLDGHIHGVHVLVATADGLARALSFPVFEATADQEGSWEPRELAAGDVNGDGRMDLVILCHDRILVYPQEK